MRTVNRTTFVEDVHAPTIIGLVNISQRYPTCVPLDEEYVTVSAGLQDNHDSVNNLTANLYYNVDDGIVIEIPMVQPYLDSYLFSTNITIDSNLDSDFSHYFTYYIEVFDTNNNFVKSSNYTFCTSQTIVDEPN
ncbi:MAG: hypothetical protein ACTSSK_08165, partial [Candidatus Heimdallarchaeota archaeon]